MDTPEEKKAWKKVKNGQRFENAFRGLHIFLKTTRNVSIYLVFTFFVIALGFFFKLAVLEWVAVVFAIGLVFVAEVINTALEIDIDLTSPEFHPYARDTKDVAAGAVLLSAFISVIIGLLIFLPKILLYVNT